MPPLPPVGACVVTVLVVCGDARRLPLPDASVDLVCTSPPYFALPAGQLELDGWSA